MYIYANHIHTPIHDGTGTSFSSKQAKEYPEYAQFLVPQIEFIVQAFVGQVNNVRSSLSYLPIYLSALI